MLKQDGPDKRAERPAIVMLHGWGMGSAVWGPVLPFLTAKYQPMCLDLPGYGEQVSVSAESLEAIADCIAGQVPESAVWVGWSLGGMVALKVAQRYPELIQKLVLVASSPCFVQKDGWMHAMQPQQLSQFAQGLVDDTDGTLKRFVALQFYGQEGVRAVSRDLQKQVVGQPMDSKALELGLEILGSEDLRDVYARLPMPVQHVYGAMDRLVPVKVAEDLACINPAVEQVVLRGVGHAPFVSHPEEFVQRLGL